MIKPVTNTLIINSYSLTILIKITPVLLKIKELTAVPFILFVKKVKKYWKPLTVFKISLKNITKILYPRVLRTLVEIRKLLPAQYYNHLPLFKGNMAAELLSHRPGINHIFTQKKVKTGKNKTRYKALYIE